MRAAPPTQLLSIQTAFQTYVFSGAGRAGSTGALREKRNPRRAMRSAPLRQVCSRVREPERRPAALVDVRQRDLLCTAVRERDADRPAVAIEQHPPIIVFPARRCGQAL